MESGFTTTLPEFSKALQDKVAMLGRAAPVVLKQEAGALARTLIKLSGPESIAKTKEAIEARARGVFGQNSREGFAIRGGKHGTGDVDWYDWKPTTLRGIAKEVDLRGRSADELYNLFKTYQSQRTAKGMIQAGQRGKQKILIWKKYVASMRAFAAMVKRVQSHIGRRQAGWLKAWRSVGSPSGTLGPVPQSVLKHEQGARGHYEDATSDQKTPSFTLVNTAKGASGLQPIIETAMRIRAKAIAADLLLYWKGVKKV